MLLPISTFFGRYLHMSGMKRKAGSSFDTNDKEESVGENVLAVSRKVMSSIVKNINYISLHKYLNI